jgi:aspartate/methionine/tyrosine aminotransferase
MEISDSQILPVNSAAFGIHLVCKSLLQTGDEAIILNPVDFLFRYAIEEVGAKAVAFSVAANDNETDFSSMEALINSNTKLICLCNPVNPTGRVFSRVELECLLMIAEKHSLIVLSDEIWSDIVYEPQAFISIGSIKNAIHSNVIVVSGMSKSFGLAGLRIGVVATGNKKLYDHLFKMSLHSSTIHGISVLSQVAAVAALDHCDPWLNDFVAHLERMRNNCVAALNRLDGVSCRLPQGTYVAFADISKTGMNSQEMQQFLLNEAKVAVVPGLPQWFGSDAEGFIRLSFATSESILTQAMNRIESAFEKIPKPTTYVS